MNLAAGTPATGSAAPALGAGAGAPGVTVSDLRWWHLETVAAAEGEAFGADAWSLAQWWEELAAPDRLHLVAQDGGGRLLAYGAVVRQGPEAELLTLAVLPPGRGRGVGELLTRALLARTAADGARVLHLEVRADNARALRLYERLGCTVVGRRPGYYDGGRVDALVCRVPLPGGAP